MELLDPNHRPHPEVHSLKRISQLLCMYPAPQRLPLFLMAESEILLVRRDDRKHDDDSCDLPRVGDHYSGSKIASASRDFLAAPSAQ